MGLSYLNYYCQSLLLIITHHSHLFSTVNKILDGFPFPTMALIVRQPNFKNISELHTKLNSSAESFQSNLGNGVLGLLYLTFSLTVYTTLLSTAFFVPVNHGSEPIIPDGATSPTTIDLRYDFQLAEYIFTEYDRTDKAIRQVLLASVKELYVRSLCHRYIRYGQMTTRQFLNHLYAIYANISPAELKLNDARLRTPYGTNHPIETLTDQVGAAVKYAASGNTPYSSDQVVSINFQLISQTGLFLDNCIIWKGQAPDLKT